MQSVVNTASEHPASIQPAGNGGGQNVARTLAAFAAHLNKSGKVCLKPWCWRRFYVLFKPGFEPPWLSAWWTIPDDEKKELFLKQLEYLAYRTDRFAAAHGFLRGLADGNWVYGSGIRIRKREVDQR